MFVVHPDDSGLGRSGSTQAPAATSPTGPYGRPTAPGSCSACSSPAPASSTFTPHGRPVRTCDMWQTPKAARNSRTGGHTRWLVRRAGPPFTYPMIEGRRCELARVVPRPARALAPFLTEHARTGQTRIPADRRKTVNRHLFRAAAALAALALTAGLRPPHQPRRPRRLVSRRPRATTWRSATPSPTASRPARR